jgi:hypothetical protein
MSGIVDKNGRPYRVEGSGAPWLTLLVVLALLKWLLY